MSFWQIEITSVRIIDHAQLINIDSPITCTAVKEYERYALVKNFWMAIKSAEFCGYSFINSSISSASIGIFFIKLITPSF